MKLCIMKVICGWSDKLIIYELLITHAHEYYPVYII
jgi:hypothetical protein